MTKKEKFVDIKELFNLLSVDRNSISKDKLLLYLSNIDGIDIDAIEDRDSYTYNDLFFMKSKKYKINIPLGTYLNKDKHFFVSNIQKIGNDKIKGILNKTLIKKKLIDSIKYNDTFILYDNFNSENPIVDNAIYMYNANDILHENILNDNYISVYMALKNMKSNIHQKDKKQNSDVIHTLF